MTHVTDMLVLLDVQAHSKLCCTSAKDIRCGHTHDGCVVACALLRAGLQQTAAVFMTMLKVKAPLSLSARTQVVKPRHTCMRRQACLLPHQAEGPQPSAPLSLPCSTQLPTCT